jgi:hypothetical protein
MATITAKRLQGLRRLRCSERSRICIVAADIVHRSGDRRPVEITVHTHPRFASDMGISWLRDTLVAMFARTG